MTPNPKDESFEVWQKRRQDKRNEVKLNARNEKYTELKKEITNLIYSDISFEVLTDEINLLISQKQVKLSTNEIREFASMYYKREIGTQERLTNADHLFTEIDHANNMIIDTNENTIGLFYQ